MYKRLVFRVDNAILRYSRGYDRLMGLSILRIILGLAAIEFYVSDYSDRRYLWGPNSYDSLSDASQQLPTGTFSLYFFGRSTLWFELVFHAGLVIAILFTVFGGRMLTVLHAVFLWSIYLRNQDILEGGDNLARIVLLLMVFTVSDAYFAPGAKRRRARLSHTVSEQRGTVLLHNFFVTAILFQIAVLYFIAGYLKSTADIWTNGTAMYYVSHIHEFSLTPVFPDIMGNVYISWSVCYFTIIAEIAVPFLIWSRRAMLRKAVTLSLEGMHLGIIVFMGLVPFGFIMIGADSLILSDADYRWASERVRVITRNVKFRNDRCAARILPEAAVGGRVAEDLAELAEMAD